MYLITSIMKILRFTVAVWAGVFAFAQDHACGQFILSPVAVTESGLGTFSPGTGLTNIINQSGLAAVPFASGSTTFDTYFTPNNKYSQNADGTKWQSNLSFDVPLVGSIDLDFGANYKLNKIAIWNISVKTIGVIIADTKAGLDTAPQIGTFTLTQNTSSVSIQADIVDLGGSFTGRYLRLAVQAEYKYSTKDTWYYATIGEVAASALPAGGPPLGVAVQSNGDVKISFSGTLQSKTNIQDTFQTVAGSPQSTYTVPKASLGSRQFFRTSN